jgi:hypothetical protein
LPPPAPCAMKSGVAPKSTRRPRPPVSDRVRIASESNGRHFGMKAVIEASPVRHCRRHRGEVGVAEGTVPSRGKHM